MKAKKRDFGHAASFIFVAIVFFMATIDVVFPFVMLAIKIVFYAVASLLFFIGAAILRKAIFKKRSKNQTEEQYKQ